MAVMKNARAKDSSSKKITDDSAVSGFILKLYEMCSGAPKDVITWTPEGDAFRIGSDLNKLESETLPQYFRHNRFQSLVRQLNFYNFRKVNRERTFWIYKHNLFHRDRPEDLHLLRRRTCPGVDGRKNRFVAVGTRKPATEAVVSRQPSVFSSDDSDRSSDDDTSHRRSQRQKKRRAAASSRGSSSKRVRKQVEDEVVTSGDEENSVQLSVERNEVSPEKAEMLEQSFVVSQVAMKLEAYAKRAKKGSSLLRNSRTRGGVVTPPTGSAAGYLPSSSTSGLFTYDDETLDDDEDLNADVGTSSPLRRRVSRESVSGADYEDALSVEQEELSLFGSVVSDASTPVRRGASPVDFDSPPISELGTVKDIVGKILASSQGERDEHTPASAAVIGFCMTTAPASGDELFTKVFDLIYSSEKLAEEFHEYRSALHPLERSSDLLPSFMYSSSNSRENRVVSVQQTLERNAGKSDAVREFKTFAVNYFHKVLLQTSGQVPLMESEIAALRCTADAWLQSARAYS